MFCRFFIQVVLLGVIAFHALGCVQRSERQVVLYCSMDREFATPILDAYERSNDRLEISRQFDVESNKSVGLANRITAEKSMVRCDVFWNGEILQTIKLQKAGLLEPHRWEVSNDYPKQFKASDGTWLATSARARVILINTDRILEHSARPASVQELSDSRWAQKCGLASPLFGTTSTHMAVLASLEGDRFWAWFKAVQTNAVLLAGNKQVAQAVSRGDLVWGITDTDDATIEVQNGAPVEIIFPDQAEGDNGLLMIPNSVAVLKDCPHPRAGRLLADYLASEQTTNRLTMAAAAQFNLRSQKSLSEQLGLDDNLKIMEVDFEKLVDTWDDVMIRLTKNAN